MSRFVKLFPICLCLFLAILFVGLSAPRFGAAAWIVPAIVAMPWLLIDPWMEQGMQARTSHALDSLLANMTTIGKARR